MRLEPGLRPLLPLYAFTFYVLRTVLPLFTLRTVYTVLPQPGRRPPYSPQHENKYIIYVTVRCYYSLPHGVIILLLTARCLFFTYRTVSLLFFPYRTGVSFP